MLVSLSAKTSTIMRRTGQDEDNQCDNGAPGVDLRRVNTWRSIVVAAHDGTCSKFRELSGGTAERKDNSKAVGGENDAAATRSRAKEDMYLRYIRESVKAFAGDLGDRAQG